MIMLKIISIPPIYTSYICKYRYEVWSQVKTGLVGFMACQLLLVYLMPNLVQLTLTCKHLFQVIILQTSSVIWIQVFLLNANDFQTELFDP